ncbi:DNA repair protein RAD50 isoform X2 [Plutella xylostella]|uniref:DNA repair protein RAD50 isoform X2 n=1 Tax=Plutella xylostella TaxID=51655 RepID=UPI00203233EA|nr:DNA repair protein RAD50 isoform X2 [Plutella xylostella]
MAGISSLSVRGIRSFGPEDNDEQRIAFDKPLTLILGQNGCGKTTIIECLRYAITGQTPPGSRNECFVHDAKINRSTEVLGQVRLKFVNAKDKQLDVSRSMKVTALPKKKSTFKTLDSFLSTVDEQGKTKDISSRCADLDFMIYEELGVSKAIINSVILCHQEDSGWPLDEGKKVKERFDEIFDADKYSDCFDKLKKMRKEYTLSIKMLTQTVQHLSEKKEELDKKKLEVVNTESKISESELKVAELTNQMNPITTKINAIVTLQKNLVQFESKKEKIKTKLEHNKTLEEELTKAIKTMFEGTTEELQENIKNYDATAKTKKKELADSHKKVFTFNKEEEAMANEMSSNEVKFNKLMLLESQQQERFEKRNKLIVTTAKLADMEMAEITNDEEAEAGSQTMADKLKTLHTELKACRASADQEERALQAAVDESRDGVTRHKQKIVGKESEIQKVNKDVIRKNKEIAEVNDTKLKLDALEKKMNTAEEEYKKQEAELNPEETQKQIEADEKVLEEHDKEYQELTAKVTKLQKESAKMKEKDIIEEQLKTKQKQLEVLKNKHRSAIVELLGDMPEKDFALSVNKLEVENKTEVDAAKKKLKSKTIEITRLEADRKHIREALTERRAELSTAEDKMYQACGTQTYPATLDKLNNAVEKLQEEQNMLQSSLFIIGKYKEQLQENNSCPLCSRGFEAQNEVTELLSDLTTKVMNVPSKLEKVTEELQKASAEKDHLLTLKTLNEKITQLKEKDIPALETRLEEADKKIAELTASVEELTVGQAEPERKLATAKQISGQMPLLDKCISEVHAASKSFESIQAQCVDFDTTTNLDEAISKQEGLRTEISALRARVKTTQTRLNQHNKKLQKMAEAKNKLKEQMLNMQKKVQELVTLQETLKQLEENKEKFAVELKELQEGITPLDAALAEAQKAKSEAVNRNRSQLDIKRSYINLVEASYEKVKTVVKEIKKHIEQNVPQEMEKVKEANEAIKEKMKELAATRTEVTKKIDMLKDELAKQEIYKRDLEDNLKLRNAQKECENCAKDLTEVEEKLSGVDVEMIKEKEPLIQQQTQLFKEKAETEGRLKELKENLKHLKVELLRSQNKNIETKYKEAFYDLEIMKAMDKDIRDYSVALERCVMEFHREKMENINLIIREMWRKIYRGNDIDYIEIKTESSMSSDSDRRKYDYRVVQCKSGVEIDMRGRCSAGQRVLACLIIRLALAETFSSRFGILALDEPTTNLDDENIRSLCSALGEIVQERMRQKNFMFIIITHDKEFIESLGNIEKVSHYYYISRNDDGKSRIKKVKFM